MSFFKRAEKEKEEVVTPATPATSEPITGPPDVVVKSHEYTDEQSKMIEELREFTGTIQLADTHEYHPWEQRFLADPGTHPRFMRAAKWKMDDAKKRAQATVEWRRDFRPDLIEPGEVSIEQETGKLVTSGFDKDGRAVLYMFPCRQNQKDNPRQVRHLVYFLERAIDLMPPNQEQMAIVIDFKNLSRGEMTSMGTARAVLHILQNHYAERLGRAFVVNVPWFVSAFISLISPFIDPVTRDKIRFNPELTDFIDAAQLDATVGGEYRLEYNHDVYWPSLNSFCCVAQDGTRVDADGDAWVPPAGMGIKYAIDN